MSEPILRIETPRGVFLLRKRNEMYEMVGRIEILQVLREGFGISGTPSRTAEDGEFKLTMTERSAKNAFGMLRWFL